MAKYVKQTWVNKDATKPASAARLGHIEDGVFDSSEIIYDGRLSDANLTSTIGSVTAAGISDPTTAIGAAAAGRFAPLAPTSVPFPQDALVAFWDFSESAAPFLSKLGYGGPLPLVNGTGSSVTKITDAESPFGNAAVFGGSGSGDYLRLAGNDAAVQLAQIGDQVTVIAWVRSTNASVGAIAGVWQEDNSDPRRQYCLFKNISLYGGFARPFFHVSPTGGASPGSQYAREGAATARQFHMQNETEFRMMAGTYDGTNVIAYLDGLADSYPAFTEPTSPNGDGRTEARNPYSSPNGLYRGAKGEFTVGAVKLTAGFSNWLGGDIGGIAVFNRALTASEIFRIYLATRGGYPVVNLDMYVQGTGADEQFKSSEYGWESARTSSGTVTSTTAGTNNFTFARKNATPANCYLTRSSGNTTIGIGYFPIAAGVVRLSQVSSASFLLNNSLASDTVRLLIRVGSAWYASDATYSMPVDGAVGTDWSTAVTKTASLARTAALWRDVTFTPGSALSIAGAARSVDIPNGDLTAVGFLSPGIPGAGVVRIRDLALT